MRKKLPIGDVLSLMDKRQIKGLTRAISIVENNDEDKEALLNQAFRKSSKDCVSLGFTGPPGAGKSTLISAIIKQYRSIGKTVGVIAVDPTSPYSGGAVLGDRIRMQEHNTDSGVYIRSLASRKALGGISEATKFVLYLYKAFCFDVIIVETLGVGQDEVDIAKFVDITAVLLVPGYGDNIQLAKAGIMEIADIFIINKSDRPGSDTLREQLLNIIYLKPEGKRPPVVNTIADRSEGIDKVVEAIESLKACGIWNQEARFRQRIIEEIRSSVGSRLMREVDHYVDEMAEKVFANSLTPIEASNEILKRLRI